MRSRATICLLLVAAGAAGCSASLPAGAVRVPAGTAPDFAARIDAIFSEHDRTEAPGCAVGVSREGELVFARGYGLASIEHGLPITPRTTFDIGSVGKQFTALGVLLLEQRGALSLDDHLRRFVPELPDYGVRITIRDLLQHTSGLRDYHTLETLSGTRAVTMDDFLELLARQDALNFMPGERHEYSHSDYELLGLVVGRAAGEPFGDFLEREVLRPLGMAHTRVHDERAPPIAGRASAYVELPGSHQVRFPGSRIIGGRNLYTSVEDLLRWERHFHESAAGRQALVDRLLERPTLASGEPIPYAFGLRLDSYRGLRIVHRGGGGLFASELMRFPDQRLAVATLCNVSPSHPLYLSRAVAEVLLEELMEPAPAQQASAPVAAPAAELERYAGVYRPLEVPWNLLTLVARDGALFEMAGDDAVPLVRLPDGTYETDGIVFTFSTPPTGGPLRLELSLDGALLEVLERVPAAELWRPGAARLDEFAGEYYSRELDVTWRLVVREGELVVQRRRFADAVLTPAQPEVFMRMLGSYQRPVYAGMRFERDAAGRVTRFILDTPPGDDSARGIVFRRVEVSL